MNNNSDFTHRPNKNSISFDSYETMADYYFKYIDTKPFNAYYERPATLSLLPDVKGKKVLDAGCAAGWYSKWLIDHGASVTALDFSPNMIKMTKRRLAGKANIKQADLNEPLTFIEDTSTDIVLSSLTLHYIKNWELPLGEFNRILTSSGQLIFSVHHPFMDFVVFRRENYFSTELLTDEWDTSAGKVKVQFYRRPLHKIISAVIQAGFTIEKLLEPMPTEKFRETQPERYNELMQKPHFLFIRAKKELNCQHCQQDRTRHP
ncbi:MAG: class I SAM-dependent methyltransferase [Pelosinus sp.]|nr:class I SAM-dependent methyltransferase [Pelosinus sp.]